MALTAEQIAKRVGLSNATVSRVLNNSQSVSAEARDAVLAVVRDSGGKMPRLLGPRPKRLSIKPTVSPGLVQILHVVRFPIVPIPDPGEVAPEEAPPELPQSMFFSREARLATSYGRHIIDGIIDELRNFGMRAVVQVAEDLRSRQLVHQINDRENKGVFLMGIYDDDVLELIDKCRVPVVSFMTWDNNGWPDYVGIDNYKGIRLSFNHVHGLGHRRIGYVAGELRFSPVFRERLAAFKACMAEAGLPILPQDIVEGSCNAQPIEKDVEALLRQPNPPTAIVCSFDGAAVGVKRAADRLGLKIPMDLSVVGFDDEDLAQLFTPALTSVHVPTVQMGRQAVQMMMMRQIRPIKPGDGCSVRVTPSLSVRASTCPPKRP